MHSECNEFHGFQSASSSTLIPVAFTRSLISLDCFSICFCCSSICFCCFRSKLLPSFLHLNKTIFPNNTMIKLIVEHNNSNMYLHCSIFKPLTGQEGCFHFGYLEQKIGDPTFLPFYVLPFYLFTFYFALEEKVDNPHFYRFTFLPFYFGYLEEKVEDPPFYFLPFYVYLFIFLSFYLFTFYFGYLEEKPTFSPVPSQQAPTHRSISNLTFLSLDLFMFTFLPFYLFTFLPFYFFTF